MMKRHPFWSTVIPYTLALSVGLAVAAFDVASPFGDDTAKGTVLLWFLACGILGCLQPHQPWRWAVLVGPWVSVTHFVRHALGAPDFINPSIFLLVPISLAICLLAAYGGSLVRNAG